MTKEREEEIAEFNGYRKLADEYNEWIKSVKENLFVNIGSQIYAIKGSGFHYGMELEFAKLIKAFAYPWDVSMNHKDKWKDDFCNSLMIRVIYDGLIEDIKNANSSKK